MAEDVIITKEEAVRLLAAKSADAVLCLLWMRGVCGCGEPPMSEERMNAAVQVLRLLGLLPPEQHIRQETRPEYTEEAVSRSLTSDKEFRALLGEVQQILGRVLSTEELKCLLSIRDYLRMPDGVIAILVSYCVQRARARGLRSPSLRAIEKEAYIWADLGIDTVETAVKHMRTQLERQTRSGKICGILQVTGRQLTAAEGKYIWCWMEWGFPDEVIKLAYEKTCLNTGGLKWQYLHSILSSWHEKGLHTLAEVRSGDTGGGKARQNAPQPAVPELERAAVRKMMGGGD